MEDILTGDETVYFSGTQEQDAKFSRRGNRKCQAHTDVFFYIKGIFHRKFAIRKWKWNKNFSSGFGTRALLRSLQNIGEVDLAS
jgi:hypothetical protein